MESNHTRAFAHRIGGDISGNIITLNKLESQECLSSYLFPSSFLLKSCDVVTRRLLLMHNAVVWLHINGFRRSKSPRGKYLYMLIYTFFGHDFKNKFPVRSTPKSTSKRLGNNYRFMFIFYSYFIK